MRIERIILKNYRQFRDVGISFRKTSQYDLYIFIGANGTGKTMGCTPKSRHQVKK